MAPTGDLPPIAIVGIGLRLPGDISTTQDFWDLLVQKRDGKCRVPRDRYNVDAFYGDGSYRQAVASDHGYFLKDANLKAFDASFFSMNRTEVEMLDPQQRLLLEVVWECMENAGQTNWRGTDIGCFVGVFGEDWHDLMTMDPQASGLFRISGNGDFAISNRISYEYNLKGPSMTIRTACSSSLMCLHEACQALCTGSCSSAIVAGTSLIMSPSMTLAMTEQGVLSPTGSCKSFDAAADGFARGEAVNAIFIKRLDHAVRDGDPVRAVIRSTAANCDGKTPGMPYPSAESHEMMMRQAYRVAGIDDISQTPYVECHGTGTQIGDPLEANAVANVFGERGTYIGSVKPNVGHSEGASGVTSLIKAVLALENNVIPPNINFSKPNPKIPFARGKLTVPVAVTPWPEGRWPRVSVNSFGIGGANAHVVVDSAASYGLVHSTAPHEHVCPGSPIDECNGNANGNSNGHSNKTNGYPNGGLERPRLIAVSANSSKSLGDRVRALDGYIKTRPSSIDRAAYTLDVRRDHLAHRTFCIADGSQDAVEFENFQKAHSETPRVLFVFTGQGAQWAGMGTQLMRHSPSFCEDIQDMDRKLQSLGEGPAWTIEEILRSPGSSDVLGKAEFAQPICTAVQVAMVNFLARCGVTPDAVVGHSSGEIAAAYAAGAITKDDAILCAYYRGRATRVQTRKGIMAAVGLGRDAVARFLVDGAVIACENSDSSVTLSGDGDAVERTLVAIKAEKPETFARRLLVDMAYHSDHMREVGQVYQDSMKHMSADKARIPLYSSVTGRRLESTALLDAAYWRSNLESPVLFKTAMQALLNDVEQKATIILEIGPHSALQAPIRQILRHGSCRTASCYVPTLVRGHDSYKSMLKAIGRVWTHGCAVDFSFLNPLAPILTDLPNYPWDHSSEFWSEGRVSLAWRQKKNPHHELLGSRCLEGSDTEPAWRNKIVCSDISWLRDHKVSDDIVWPCAAYIAMLGEAIKQETGSDAYAIRNMVIKSALVLHETETVEIVTTMRPLRLTDGANASWFEFSIMAFDGTRWTQHCAAQGKALEDDAMPRRPIISRHCRQLSEAFWYERMRHLGLNYGPQFQGLTEISAHPKEDRATAAIRNNASEAGARYPVHPTTLDFCLQLLTVAVTRGVARRLATLAIPTAVASIRVKPCGPRLVAEASAQASATGVIRGRVVATTEENEAAVVVDDGVFSPLQREGCSDGLDSAAAARLEWRPDIDFSDARRLMRRASTKRDSKLLIEKVCALCILQALDALSSLRVPPGHLTKYAAWLQGQKEGMVRGQRALTVPEAQEWATSPPDQWDDVVVSLSEELERLGDRDALAFAHMARRISKSDIIESIVLGHVNLMQLLVEDGGLTHMYDFFNGMIDSSDFFSLCAHGQPTLKVLEIGAGTGGTTDEVLRALMAEQGTRMYSQYTFTDVSSGFFAAAQERFRDKSGMEYKVLDITKDAAEQGFELGSYDLIVASNVLHATPSLRETLRNVRSLLRSGGRLFLQELSQPLTWRCVPFVTGLLPGWWAGESDGRSDEPFVSVQRWHQELLDTGFSGTDAALLDDDFPYQVNVNMIASAIQQPEPATGEQHVTLLYNQEKHEFACSLAGRLAQAGVGIQWRQVGRGESIPGRDVIATMDLEGPYLHDISATEYEALMGYLSTLQAGVLWLTRPAQVRCVDPRYGLTIGFARTIRSELSLDFSTMELQCLDSAAVDAVMGVLGKFQRRSASGEYDVEAEFAVHDGVILTGRYHWIQSNSELELELPRDAPCNLVIGRTGLVDSLHWLQHEAGALASDQVEVHMRCVGLNFRDVLVAMGIVDSPKDGLGLEASGIVTRVAPTVDHVRPGDRVMTMLQGAFATRKMVPGQLVVRIPDSLSFEEAATMPAVYATVIHCIVNLGQLAKGQSILIQSACGGVGLAALQICKMLGADIYVTVGNEDKVKYLMETYRLPRDRIFHSRNTSFLRDVMRATNGRGVDMVLNSLSGELLHASWQCVAKFGKMMEIGKRDFMGRGQLMLDPFEANRTFYGVDLATFRDDRPHEIRRLMEQCLGYYEAGHVKPIRPYQVFAAPKVADAFRCMQRGLHMGKILISMPEGISEMLSAVKPRRQITLSDEACYLLVGGLGGLGKALTTWMVEQGARNFVFLSRSAGASDEDQAFLGELEAQECRAVAVAGSVVELADVQRAVRAAPAPIAGVVQMSMVLRDLPLTQIGFDDWNAVLGPKVKGTWNLHEALLGVKLDFFILFSSITAVFGQPGQANYAAANSFLESFVQYRHGINLPCSVVGVGFMEGIGYVSKNAAVLKQAHAHALSIYTLQEQDLLNAIQISIHQSLAPPAEAGKHGYCNPGQLIIGLRSSKPLSDPGNRAIWKRDLRMSLYRQLETSFEDTSIESSDGRLRGLLTSAASSPDVLYNPDSLEIIIGEIGRTICGFMMLPEEDLDVTQSLGSMGVDSLVGIEIRNWWRRTLGVEITVLEIMKAGTVGHLGQTALALLRDKFAAKADPKALHDEYLAMKAP